MDLKFVPVDETHPEIKNVTTSLTFAEVELGENVKPLLVARVT